MVTFSPFQFGMKHHLDKHVERLHATSPAAESAAVFQCERCPKKYSRKDRLTAHERTAHNGNGEKEDERPHACDLCQYRYTAGVKVFFFLTRYEC
jgi:uncharacterized Zn-finger protein